MIEIDSTNGPGPSPVTAGIAAGVAAGSTQGRLTVTEIPSASASASEPDPGRRSGSSTDPWGRSTRSGSTSESRSGAPAAAVASSPRESVDGASGAEAVGSGCEPATSATPGMGRGTTSANGRDAAPGAGPLKNSPVFPVADCDGSSASKDAAPASPATPPRDAEAASVDPASSDRVDATVGSCSAAWFPVKRGSSLIGLYGRARLGSDVSAADVPKRAGSGA